MNSVCQAAQPPGAPTNRPRFALTFSISIQASEGKAHLPRLLDAVERGETLIITRHGGPVARIVPEADLRRAEMDRAIAEIEKIRKTMPRIPLEDILTGRHEGHKY